MKAMVRCVALGLVAFAVGCGGGESGPPTAKVSGTVTLDGTPVAKGSISFDSPEGGGGGIDIVDGKYSGAVSVGSFTVKITAPKEVGEKDETGMATLEETIPEKFNVSSELKAEIKEGENTDVNFDLKS